MIGQTLDGRYRLTRVLGEGGMGVVYEAQHIITGRRSAIKLISRMPEDGAAEILSRFEREARVAGSIETPHIAQVLDAGRDAVTNYPFMVMELLQGEDLGHAIKRLSVLPADVALRIVAQACAGLAKAHEVGVVHRDIKPGNLFLQQRESGDVLVKVLDFGIAKLRPGALGGSEPERMTMTGSLLGTPHYMSPEQAKGLRTIDHRADVWSMGVMLYRLLAGQTPHEHADTLGGLVVAICTEEPRQIQDVAPWVSPEVAAVVHGALRLAPAARYPNMTAMFEAIRALIPGGSTSIDARSIVALSPAEQARVQPRSSVSGSTVTGVSMSASAPLPIANDPARAPTAPMPAVQIAPPVYAPPAAPIAMAPAAHPIAMAPAAHPIAMAPAAHPIAMAPSPARPWGEPPPSRGSVPSHPGGAYGAPLSARVSDTTRGPAPRRNGAGVAVAVAGAATLVVVAAVVMGALWMRGGAAPPSPATTTAGAVLAPSASPIAPTAPPVAETATAPIVTPAESAEAPPAASTAEAPPAASASPTAAPAPPVATGKRPSAGRPASTATKGKAGSSSVWDRQ